MTNPYAVKFVEGSDDLIEGLILPNGGPLRGNDLTGTRFTPGTDFCTEWFPDGGRPGLYGHGFDPELGVSVVGREVKSWKDDKGTWMRGQLDKAHAYWSDIKALVDQGALSLSSGAVDHLVTATKSGEITRWPWVEWSLVPNPANPDAVVYAVRSTDAVAHMARLGIAAPAAVTAEAKKDSSAAWDASTASSLRATLTDLLGNETDDAEQATQLRTALAALDAFIAAETAEIGTPEDVAETAQNYYGAYFSLKNALTPQALHDAALASGAACRSSETPEPPALGLAIAGKSTEQPAVDLAAIKAQLTETAIALAKELTGQ